MIFSLSKTRHFTKMELKLNGVLFKTTTKSEFAVRMYTGPSSVSFLLTVHLLLYFVSSWFLFILLISGNSLSVWCGQYLRRAIQVCLAVCRLEKTWSSLSTDTCSSTFRISSVLICKGQKDREFKGIKTVTVT